MGRTCASTAATIKHGGIKSTPGRSTPNGVCSSQRQDNFVNLEREKDQDKRREGNVHTTYTSKSHSKVRSHVSQKQDDNKALQQEIDD